MNAYELAKQLEERHAPYEDDAANMLRQQAGELEYYKVRDSSHIKIIKAMADRIAELENPIMQAIGIAFEKPLSDEEIYALWCEADNTELLPEMRLKDGSINYIITTFAKLIEERHGIK